MRDRSARGPLSAAQTTRLSQVRESGSAYGGAQTLQGFCRKAEKMSLNVERAKEKKKN